MGADVELGADEGRREVVDDIVDRLVHVDDHEVLADGRVVSGKDGAELLNSKLERIKYER